jgi:AcrR family transcriptional regulator
MAQTDPHESTRQRMRKTLEAAFVQLLREKPYDAITIGDIVERASVGRTTYYRHFENKIDLLVGLHEGVFDQLTVGYASRADWLAEHAPPQVAAYLSNLKEGGKLRYAAFTFGKDASIFMRRIEEQLIRQFETRLSHAFRADEMHTPIPILARAVTGTYYWMMVGWFDRRAEFTSAQLAEHAHRLVRAMIRDSLQL